jgi:hypothetical protein
MHLDPEQIVETVRVLRNRIRERFPNAQLNGVCDELLRVARQARQRSIEISRPMVGVRILSTLLVLLILVAFGVTVRFIKVPEQPLQATEFIQVLEAGFSGLVLIGATVLFLVTLEIRVKRARALKAIHELRSIAHLVDMHQLTKDPDRLLRRGQDTPSSPRRTMTPFEMERYLDYCTEMLSLTGKIAALYVEDFPDAHAVGAVNDVENLTSGLARKIWQKVMILHAAPASPEATLPEAVSPQTARPAPPAPSSAPETPSVV